MRKHLSKLVMAWSACPLFTATIALALAFTISCTSSDPGGTNFNCQLLSGGCIQTVSVSDCSQAGGSVVDFCQLQSGSSSSSTPSVPPVTPSSSSLRSGSSSSVTGGSFVGTSGNFTDARNGRSYRWVKIGEQTWMAENLNFNANGSKCGDGSSLSDANTLTCDTYGRLYDWATAMGLDASCNSKSCTSQVMAKRQGICPDGWHIPSGAEWDVLMKFVNPSCSNFSFLCAEAGTKLKAKSSWNSNGNGQDTYGFSALPGGYGFSDGSFYDVGSYGIWWSASEYDAFNAYSRVMVDEFDGVIMDTGYKINRLFSVRCLQGYIGGELPPSSSSVPPQSGIIRGSPVPYEGEIYETVVIGPQTWMARNLNYVPASGTSACYNNDPANCATYGRLYDWATAMGIDASCNSSTCASQVGTKHMGICPIGWHIPSKAEWDALSGYVQRNKGCTNCDAEHLKAVSGWNSNGNGLDSYGFSALPGGYCNSIGFFYGVGGSGNWWSNSEYDSNYAYFMLMYSYNDYANYHYDGKYGLFSIRCVQD